MLVCKLYHVCMCEKVQILCGGLVCSGFQTAIKSKLSTITKINIDVRSGSTDSDGSLLHIT